MIARIRRALRVYGYYRRIGFHRAASVRIAWRAAE
jgi:hypothetical protein